jgi:Fur family peroxide stress response transcriptional regulator
MTRTAETRLRKAGYRVTRQRVAVYNYLLSTDTHPTAEAIHLSVRRELPYISLATIYTAVDSLVDVGLVSRIQRGASSARYDAAVEDHAHCRCLGCDGVWDAARNAIPQGDPTPEAFEVVHVNVEFIGYCVDCRRQKLGLAPLNTSTKPRSSL